MASEQEKASVVRIPRLELGDFPPSLADSLRPRVARLGYLGEFFKCAAHTPAALEAFVSFTEASKSPLPEKWVEVVALTCAAWMNNVYERNQHERLCVRLGFGRDWITAVLALEPDAQSGLNEDERGVQELVLRVLSDDGHGAGELFSACVDRHGPTRAMAILMVVGRYVTHALIVNTLALDPPVPSVFEDGFSG